MKTYCSTVYQLKELIKERLTIPFTNDFELLLYFNCKILNNNNKSLFDYNIQNNQYIDLTLKLIGGSSNSMIPLSISVSNERTTKTSHSNKDIKSDNISNSHLNTNPNPNIDSLISSFSDNRISSENEKPVKYVQIFQFKNVSINNSI